MAIASTTQIKNLNDEPKSHDAVFHLIEENFPKGSPLSRALALEEEFFQLLNPKNRKQVLFLEDTESGKILSSVSWHSFEVNFPTGRTLRVAAIGLVVTARDARGKGHAKSLMDAAENAATQNGALLCFLWSDLLEYYAKRDYLPLGSELSWILEAEDKALRERKLLNEFNLKDISCREAEKKDLAACLELYHDLQIGPKRTLETFQAFRNLPNTSFLVVSSPTLPLAGYGLIGKARDLRNTLHEVVGNKVVVPALLRELFALPEATNLRVQYPPEGPLAEELVYWLGNATPEAFSLIKVLQPQAFIAWMEKNAPLPGIKIQSLGERGFRLLGRGGKEYFKSADPAHLIQLFMSPFHPSEFGILPDEALKTLSNFRALNPYFWGLDSV